jgi:hypothetical protein
MEQISNTLTNRQLFKKAYLIEFYASNPVKPEEIFTFSVPPKSEELTYPQKKVETKTFGGLHVDDYGVDAVKVILKGSTINQSIKRIYKGGFKDDKWLSGEEEMYYLRDLIVRYKELEFLKDNPNAKIMIYDLSKYTGLRLGGTIDNYWQAFLGELRINRADDKPFTYNYTLEFTGVPPTEGLRKGLLPLGSNPIGALQTIMNALKTALDFMNNIGALVDDVMGYVDQVSSLLNMAGRIMAQTTSTITGIMDSVGNAATGLIGGATSVVDGANSIISLPRTVQLKALSIGLDLQNASYRLVKSTTALAESCRALFDDETYEIPQEVLDIYAMNKEEFEDSIGLKLNEAENIANTIAAQAKSSEIPDVTEGSPDEEGNPQTVLSYGYSTVTLKETDSLESLATDYFGDPDRAIDIATYNNVASLSDLNPGDGIKIPITTRTVKMANNLVFARREDRDNYGRDILLDDNGFIVMASGDYQLATGVQNLCQAILLRLREANAKRIRLTVYGIRSNISDPTAGIAYIISSVRLTVSNDPRVSAVDDIKFKGSGDALYIDVFYHDINKAVGKVSGRV